MNKTKEILMFLLIFGLVSNVLNFVSISATDYSEDSLGNEVQEEVSLASAIGQVGLTITVAIAGAILGFIGGTALGLASMGGMDPIKVAGFTAFGGLLAGTLIPLIGIINAVALAVPDTGRNGFIAVMVIFLGVLSIVLIYNFIEMTLQYHGGGES